mmetsp:Transcript_16034/g.38830  ORF Transcript_16034/g.38830 Transcript_16034/m.38830 type:complete len:258 (-) Transcript_16034:5-778(-)
MQAAWHTPSQPLVQRCTRAALHARFQRQHRGHRVPVVGVVLVQLVKLPHVLLRELPIGAGEVIRQVHRGLRPRNHHHPVLDCPPEQDLHSRLLVLVGHLPERHGLVEHSRVHSPVPGQHAPHLFRHLPQPGRGVPRVELQLVHCRPDRGVLFHLLQQLRWVVRHADVLAEPKLLALLEVLPALLADLPGLLRIIGLHRLGPPRIHQQRPQRLTVHEVHGPYSIGAALLVEELEEVGHERSVVLVKRRGGVVDQAQVN